jgi:hypothetical protein
VVCAYFGGPTDQSLVLVGYRQSSGAASVGTASGVQVGSKLGHHRDTIQLTDEVCGTTVGGEADGVAVLIDLEPDSAAGGDRDGVVVGLEAGSTPQREGDAGCP